MRQYCHNCKGKHPIVKEISFGWELIVCSNCHQTISGQKLIKETEDGNASS